MGRRVIPVSQVVTSTPGQDLTGAEYTVPAGAYAICKVVAQGTGGAQINGVRAMYSGTVALKAGDKIRAFAISGQNSGGSAIVSGFEIDI